MKLAITFLAALAESKFVPGSKRIKEPEPGSDSKAAAEYHYVPALECSNNEKTIITHYPNADGVSGSIVMERHGNREHCFIEVGPQCSYGVDVEIVTMNLEAAAGYYYSDTGGVYTYVYNGIEYDYEYDYCYDAMFFTHKQKGELKKTDQQCGSHGPLENGADYYGTLKPTKYWLNGDDTKLVFSSDGSVSGKNKGFVVDWKCHEN